MHGMIITVFTLLAFVAGLEMGRTGTVGKSVETVYSVADNLNLPAAIRAEIARIQTPG